MEWTDERMDDLANRMDAGFDRVDSDIRDLRGEMREEFKAVRGEMREGFAEIRTEMVELRGMISRVTFAMIAGAFALSVALMAAVVSGALSS